jgi:hypothetical protein
VPNAALRSALFCADNLGQGPRDYVKGRGIIAQEGIRISATGEQLDQGDLDAFIAVVHIARLQALGEKCRCTAAKILQVMGIKDSGQNRKTLDDRLSRIKAVVIIVDTDKYTYQGNLFNDLYREKESNLYVIMLNEKLIDLFSPDQYTKIDCSVRQYLIGKPLAQWLHGYYSSHAEPYPVSVATLKNLCGSQAAEMKKFSQTLRRALTALAGACTMHGQPFGHSIRGDLVEIQRQPSTSQARHLARRAAAKPRRPKP